jgi:hypothetical protein
MERHPRDIRYVFKNFVFQPQGKASDLSEMAAAAQKISDEAFWVVHDLFFRNDGQALLKGEKGEVKRKIEEILKDENTSVLWKEKIGFIQEVKGYGEERLGLRKTKSYSKFFEVKGSILYVVTAAEKDRLQLYTWKFPIIGKVTYKVFTTKEAVLKEEQSLEKKD